MIIGIIYFKNILLANNGFVIYLVMDGIIIFILSIDFEGMVYFNYVVCDSIGICDNGMVSISVLG